MKNPCEKHLNVRASDGYCPICLLDEIAQLRAELDEMQSSQHDAAMTMMQDEATIAELRAELDEMRKALEKLYVPAKIAVNQIICMGGKEICQPCQNRELLAMALDTAAVILSKYPVHPKKEEK